MSSFFGKFNPDGMAQRIVNAKEKPIVARKVFEEGVTVEEVAKHNKKDDCWLIYEDRAYDLSGWVDRHPGGDVLLSYAGRDATDIFEAFHDNSTKELLQKFYIGKVNDLKLTEAIKAHRALYKKFEEQNMFEASYGYYIYKFLSTVSILATGVWICANYSSTWRVVLGGFLVGLFWQQCGWLSHDFLHHQVFKNREYNNLAGYLIGNVFQGFSVSWWKAKHNLHHACPNVAGFDPDIDTMPFLAWSEKLFEGELEGLPHFLIKYQYIMYWPIICGARLSWLIQSNLYARFQAPEKRRTIEFNTLMVHYIWYASVLLFTMNSISEALLFFVVSQATTGVLLATAFSLGHNGMTIYQKGAFASMDFNRLQVQTGRDVSGPSIVHWYMGGLDKQIEHHLYPKIPRHNLDYVQSLVVPLCAKFGIVHHTTNFWDGTKETIARLNDVASYIH